MSRVEREELLKFSVVHINIRDKFSIVHIGNRDRSSRSPSVTVPQICNATGQTAKLTTQVFRRIIRRAAVSFSVRFRNEAA